MSAEKKDPTDFRSAFILICAAILPAIFVYYGSAAFFANHIPGSEGAQNQYYYFLSSFILLGLIPLFCWVFVFKKNLPDMGLSLGNIKKSLRITIIGLPVIVILAFITAKSPSFRAEYPLYRGLLADPSTAPAYWLILGLYYIGWEFFFRGFMLLGLESGFGQLNSILIQTIPSCLVHIGKPDAEIFGSIIAGIIFGWAVFRCRSLWPVLILHWSLAIFLDIFIIYG